jgi:hypothetical protein
VIAKGGPNANVYTYLTEVTSDTGLHAPVNPNNNRFFGLSHISFCYDVEAPTTTPPTTAPTTTSTTTTTVPPTTVPPSTSTTTGGSTSTTT